MLATVILAFACVTGTPAGAAQFEYQGKALKTRPADANKIDPFVNELFAFDEAAAKSGKAPKDAKERLRKLQSLAPQLIGEMRSLTARLKANREVELFDAMALDEARSSGSPNAVTELQGAGGAYAIISATGQIVNESISIRRAAAGAGATNFWYQLLGIRDAQAGLVCGIAYWAITLTKGYNIAYRACYY
jgi:hypothetical protein